MTRRRPTVANVMTPFPHSIEADAGLDEARALLDRHGIRHLPVTHAARLVGVLSDRDLLVAALVAERAPGPELRVADVCTPEPYGVDLHTPLLEVATQMAERHLGCTVVLREGKLAGILTATDAWRLLAELLREGGAPRDSEPA